MLHDKRPDCSVVIIHHNRISMLCQQLMCYDKWDVGSLVIEFIVVDNSNLVSTKQSVLRERFKWVRFIFLSENKGPAHSRNIGIEVSTAELIQFIDDDDLITWEKLDSQIRYLLENSQTDVVIGGTQKTCWSEHNLPSLNQIEVTYPAFNQVTKFSDILKTDGFFQIGSALFRRNSLNNINGFNEKMLLIEDVNLYLRLFVSGAVMIVNKKSPFGLFWRGHPTNKSLSNSNHTKFLYGCLYNLLFCLEATIEKSEGDYRDIFHIMFNVLKNLDEKESTLRTEALDKLKKLTPFERFKYLPPAAIFSNVIGFQLLFLTSKVYRAIKVSTHRFIKPQFLR